MIGTLLKFLGTPIVDKVIGKFFDNKEDLLEFKKSVEELEQEIVKEQLKVNATEAKHRSLFVAGWRPFIGWVGGISLAVNYLIVPIANITLALLGNPLVIPALDLSSMMPIIIGMLGLGGFRTYEKYKGVAK